MMINAYIAFVKDNFLVLFIQADVYSKNQKKINTNYIILKLNHLQIKNNFVHFLFHPKQYTKEQYSKYTYLFFLSYILKI